jgi:hypothetical protein
MEVMYLTTIYPQLLILITNLYSYYGIYIYICAGPGASTRRAVNSSECQRSEDRIEVMSLNTPTTSMDIFIKLRKW